MTPRNAKARGAAGQAQSKQQMSSDDTACFDVLQAMVNGTLRNREAIARANIRRRLPAYGRKLLALRARGLAPTVAVLILGDWRPRATLDEYTPWLLIVPDDEPAASFDFHCVAGLFAFVVAETIARADEIAVQVLRYSPRAVYGWADELGCLAFYIRERS
jgi:hypothetical protein